MASHAYAAITAVRSKPCAGAGQHHTQGPPTGHAPAQLQQEESDWLGGHTPFRPGRQCPGGLSF